MSKKNRNQKVEAAQIEAPASVETSTAQIVESSKPAPKIKKPTIAGIFDQLILAGGTWEEITAKAKEQVEALKLEGKISGGLARAHYKFRKEHQKKAEFQNLELNEKGVAPAVQEAA